jgi:multidrug efflux system outer membrane protein
VRRSVEASKDDVEASVASLENTQVSLASEVALNYVDVRTRQILLGIARDNLASQSETLQLTVWREQAGLVSSQDVEQARSNREQTRAQIPALETSLAESEHRLDILLGKVPGTLHARLAANGDLPVVPDQIAVGIPADTLRQRPDVRAAERRLAAETARVGVAEAARYPSFTLSGSIGLEALTLGGLGSGDAVISSLFAGITGPIFDAGRLRAQVEIQDAVREQALVAYEQTVLTALQDVENALVALVRNRERVEALASAVESVRNAAQLARQRYSAGLIDFQSVLDSERSVLVLEESLASARANGVQTLIRLYKALGGGWSPQAEVLTVYKDAP